MNDELLDRRWIERVQKKAILAFDNNKLNKEYMAIYIKGYRDFSKMLYDHDHGFIRHNPEEIESIRKMVQHMENTINYLDESERFIIYNELILHKTGKWYLEYYSESSYRRKCKTAYSNYLRLLEL